MDAKGPLSLLLLAQTTALLIADREYVIVHLLKTWAEAQSYCKANFSDLATITTAEESTHIKEMHNLIYSNSIFLWIGLYDDVNSWRWSLDGTSLYVLDDWFVFHRDNYQSGEQCAFVLGGELYDGNCDEPLNAVCYDEPSNSYFPAPFAMNWMSAQTYCRQTYTDLAMMRNLEQMETIRSMIDDGSKWWIGLSRQSWKWSDNSGFTFNWWHDRQPDKGGENCVATHYFYGWYDRDCSEKYYFICSVPTPTKNVFKIKLKSEGNLDLNNPLIGKGILKQVEQQMKDQGIPHNFTLKWRKQPNGKVFNEVLNETFVHL